MIIDHTVHPFDEMGILCLEELMTWIRPFLDGLFDKFPGDNEWVIVRELSCFGPTLYLSD